MTRRMATWGEWAGSFWQSRVWTAHGCLRQAVQARLVDMHAFRFICHIFGGISNYYLRLTGMVWANEKMKLQDLTMLKIWFLFDLLQFIDLVALCPSRNLSDALAFTSERRDLDGSPGNLTVLCTSACIPSRCSHQGVKTKTFETSENTNLKTFSWRHTSVRWHYAAVGWNKGRCHPWWCPKRLGRTS